VDTGWPGLTTGRLHMTTGGLDVTSSRLDMTSSRRWRRAAIAASAGREGRVRAVVIASWVRWV
jgi:hypothetical protein